MMKMFSLKISVMKLMVAIDELKKIGCDTAKVF
jgi:hypothetical protein